MKSMIIEENKKTHRLLTDAIRPTIKKNAKVNEFAKYQILINRSLGLAIKNDKSKMTTQMIRKITERENMVVDLINKGCEFKYIAKVLINLIGVE